MVFHFLSRSSSPTRNLMNRWRNCRSLPANPWLIIQENCRWIRAYQPSCKPRQFGEHVRDNPSILRGSHNNLSSADPRNRRFIPTETLSGEKSWYAEVRLSHSESLEEEKAKRSRDEEEHKRQGDSPIMGNVTSDGNKNNKENQDMDGNNENEGGEVGDDGGGYGIDVGGGCDGGGGGGDF